MQVACRFAEYGCWVLDAKTVVDQHEKTCRFWKVKCPFHSHNCYGYLMPIHDIPQHFIDWHRGQWEELDEGREDYFTISYTGYDLESELDWSFPFMCDGKHFILIVSSCEDENWAVCFIYILGSEQDANQYGCTLEISDDDKEETVTYKSKSVNSIDLSIEDVVNNGWGLVMTTGHMERFGIWNRKSTRQRLDIMTTIKKLD